MKRKRQAPPRPARMRVPRDLERRFVDPEATAKWLERFARYIRRQAAPGDLLALTVKVRYWNREW